MQLNPLEQFTVVRQIEDHTDLNTYYVRAVIRNARTDALITTLNLTNQGNQRFSRAWQVSPDVSGQGFYVSITTSVYTDSGYTTKSENYGDREQTYLVQARMNNVLGGSGGGGGPDIDYKKIKEIIDTQLKIRLGLDKEESLEMPEIPKVIEVTKEVPTTFNLDDLPKPTDISPLIAICEGITSLVKTLNEGQKEIKDSQISKDEIIEGVNPVITRSLEASNKQIKTHISREIADQTKIIAEKIESELSNVSELMETTPIVRFPDIKSPVKPEKAPQDRRISRVLTKI